MLPGPAEAQTRLRPRDLEEKTADTVHLVRSTTGVAVRGLTRSTRNADEPEDGHQAINVMSKSVYPWSCQTDSETTYPSADWDRMSLTQRVIDDFTSETAIPRISDETEASVSYVNPTDPRRTDRISVRACSSMVLKPCRVTWVPVKMSGNFPEGKVPEISPTLINRGMSMFEHTGFTGETIGQPYGISICNKSHRKFRIS